MGKYYTQIWTRYGEVYKELKGITYCIIDVQFWVLFFPAQL